MRFSAVGLSAALASLSFLFSCSDSAIANANGTDDAGSGKEAPLPEYQSGSRLRAKLLAGDPSAALFVGWHDRTLESDCAFGWAEDGSFRCLPKGPAIGNTFSDPECTKRAIVVTPTCDVPKFARGDEICASGRPIYKVGSKLSVSTIYVKQSSGSCSSGPANGLDLYDASELISPDDLVGGEPKTTPLRDGLGVVQIVAVDGAVETSSAFDTEHKGPCEAKSLLTERCLPSNVAFEEGYFSDSTCKTSAAIKTTCGDPPNSVIRSATSSSCGDDPPTFAQIGNPISGAVYRGDEMCEEAKAGVADSFYEIGSDIPIASFPTVAKSDVGEGRIQIRNATNKSGDLLLGRTLFDRERNEECVPTPSGDNKTRCIPPSNGRIGVRYFSDIECTKPLAFVAEGCIPPAFVQLHTQLQTACGEYTIRVFAVGEGVSPSTVYLNSAGACEGAPSPASTLFFDASKEVPSSAFAEVATKTE